MRGFLRFAVMTLGFAFWVGCASTPKPPPPSPVSTPIHLKVIREAMTLQGVPYRWGEETPHRGFDCSGFVQYLYGKHGVDLPRTAFDMAMALPTLDETMREPGDLVFFNTTGRPYSHVGIYIGENRFIHASSREGEVMISELDAPYWTRHYQGTRRARHHRASSKEGRIPIGRWFY